MSNFVFSSSFIFVYYHQFEEKKKKPRNEEKKTPKNWFNDKLFSIENDVIIKLEKKVKDKLFNIENNVAFKIFLISIWENNLMFVEVSFSKTWNDLISICQIK